MNLQDQIRHELGATLADPVGCLLGLDLDTAIRTRINERVEWIAATVARGADHERAELVIDIMNALFGDGEPPIEWWGTPLGQACAGSLGVDTAEAVSQSVAGAILGVTRGTIAQMLARGGTHCLERHPDGGIVLASVLRERDRRDGLT